jgi:hypothetical protein
MRADGSGQRRYPERGLRREMVGLISAAAKQASVDLFPRFALMQGCRPVAAASAQ